MTLNRIAIVKGSGELSIMCIRNIFFVGFTLLSNLIWGQYSNSIAMSGIKSCDTKNWSVLNNPAGMTRNPVSTALASYSSRFNIPELDEKTLAYTHVMNNKSLGVYYSQFGDQRLSLSTVSFSFGQDFGEQLSLGAGVNLQHLRQESFYGNKTSLYSHFGILIRPSEKGELGFLLINPEKRDLNNELNHKIPTSLSLSYSHRFSKVFKWINEMSLLSTGKIDLATAFMYRMRPNFEVVSTINFYRKQFSMAMEVIFHRFYLSFAWAYESNLGLQSRLALIFKTNKAS